MMKKKLKTLPLSSERQTGLMETRDNAIVSRQKEHGVHFVIEEIPQEDGSISQAILFQEGWHSKQDISIAAARVNALYFVNQIFVTDLVVN